MVVYGEICFDGILHVEGRIEGTVLSKDADALFILTESGQVKGDIRVPSAIIDGKVIGDIHTSEKLELTKRARIDGNVSYKLLKIAVGAEVNGRVACDEGCGQHELLVSIRAAEPS